MLGLDGPASGVGINTLITFDAQPVGPRLELTAAVSSYPIAGKFRPFQVPDTAYARVQLETDGVYWTEREGPTQLFGQLGTLGGLAWFFPALPPSGDPGSHVVWSITRPDPHGVLAVEAARGTRPGLREAQKLAPQPVESKSPSAATLEVRLDHWSQQLGVAVAHLAVTGSETVTNAMSANLESFGKVDTKIQGTFKYKGTYEVLATGRVLRADLKKDGEVLMITPFGEQKHELHAVMAMHLVGACDGPIAETLAAPRTLEERAIDAWGEASMAFAKSERDKVLTSFSPSLRSKHGDAAIWAALTTFRDLRGVVALPPPLFVQDRDVEVQGELVRLRVSGTTPDLGRKNSAAPFELTIVLREVDGRFLVESLRADLTIDPANLLSISVSGLTVRQGWPPK
jgi:hypothetical protein